MALNKYLDIAPEVRKALEEGRPVVALESTIISHGMPYPQNVETALNVEKIIRDNGAVPATIAVIMTTWPHGFGFNVTIGVDTSFPSALWKYG